MGKILLRENPDTLQNPCNILFIQNHEDYNILVEKPSHRIIANQIFGDSTKAMRLLKYIIMQSSNIIPS